METFNFTEVKSLLAYFPVAAILFVIFSCQKEIHYDLTSEGSLAKDGLGNCLPITVNGKYTAGKELDGSNSLEVLVHVTAIGSYTVSSDTVNGFSFSTSGNFKDTGSIFVTLKGKGKPLSAANDHFNISYSASNCVVDVPVLDSSSVASFTLQGAPGVCMLDTINGDFVKGFPVDTSARVKIKVNVTTAGTYSIATNTVNGYSFSDVGTFSATGIQTISLKPSGTPTNTGTDVFTVTAGSTSCTFSSNVLTAIATVNNDLFPLTTGSFWNYDDLYHKGNIVKNSVIDTATFNGFLYSIMELQAPPASPLTSYYRKSSNDYLEYMQVDKYTNSFHFDRRTNVDLPFLSETLKTGDSWQTKEFTDTASFGQVLVLQYRYACLAADVAAVVNGKAFSHVYKIQMHPWLRTLTDPYGSTGEVYTYYYAKGVGLIYYKEMVNQFLFGEWQIRDWMVN